MNSKIAKKLRKISTVYGVHFKDVERGYKLYGDDFIKKYEERGGLENYGKIKKEIKKVELKAFTEVMAEEAAKGTEVNEIMLLDGSGKPFKKIRSVKTLEGGDAKDTDSSAVISD